MAASPDQPTGALTRLSLAEASRICPEDIALVLGGKDYSYGDLNRLAESARVFLSSEWDGRSPVALVCSQDLDSLLFLFVCLEKHIPLLLIHPRWSDKLRDEFVHDVAPLFVWENGRARRHISTPEPSGSLLSTPVLQAKTQILIGTSGSSGKPKIVLLSSSGLIAAANASATNLPWQEGDRWLLSLPFAHIGGLSIILRCLLAGKTVVCAKLDPKKEDFSDRLDALGITLLSLVPTQLHSWLRIPSPAPRRLRAILIGGAACAPRLCDEARERGLPVLRSYGLSEMASQVATECFDEVAKGTATSSTQVSGVGAPLSGVEIRIDGQGRVSLKGPQLMLGYLGQTEKSTFQDGWFSTNDRGELSPQGELSILGRADHLIISGGENISPEWIESALTPSPGIAEICVLGLPDPHWGQLVVAAIAVEKGSDDDAVAESIIRVQQLSRNILPDYAQPKKFIVLEELAHTPSGKLDRQRVQDAVATRLSDPET